MSIGKSNIEIGKHLLSLRKKKGMTQEDISQLLNIPRSSVAQIESGKRNLSVEELIILSNELHISINEFLSNEYNVDSEIEMLSEGTVDYAPDRIAVPKWDINKFKNILLYILEQCAGKPNVGETVLYKLLYFCDFNYYELYEEHLSGAKYRKLDYGPVPHRIETVLEKMVEKQQLKRIKTKYHSHTQTRYLPLEKADLTKLNAAEKEVIDQVIDNFADWSGSSISQYSHNDLPWKATEYGKEINYELAFYRELPYSVRNYGDEKERP